MNTTIRTLLASAFLVTAGSALAADGEYYQGVSARQSVVTDNLHTGSVQGEVSASRFVGQASTPSTAATTGTAQTAKTFGSLYREVSEESSPSASPPEKKRRGIFGWLAPVTYEHVLAS